MFFLSLFKDGSQPIMFSYRHLMVPIDILGPAMWLSDSAPQPIIPNIPLIALNKKDVTEFHQTHGIPGLIGYCFPPSSPVPGHFQGGGTPTSGGEGGVYPTFLPI